jgi:hypothetical protein
LEDGDGNKAILRLVLVDDAGEPIAAAEPVPPDRIRRYRFFLRFPERTAQEDVSGELTVSGGGAPGSVPLTASEKSIADASVSQVLWWPLVPAALLILIGGTIATAGKETTLLTRLPADLDFKTSFASTVTAVGALLATVVSANVLPEATTTTLSKEEFVALNLIFLVAIAVAGLLYSAIQIPTWKDVPNPEKDQAGNTLPPVSQARKMEGLVIGLLLASLVTVWAVFGELVMLWQLLDALGGEQGFTADALAVIKCLVVVAGLTMIAYTIQRIPVIVVSQRKKQAGTEATPVQAEPQTSVSLL